ncbi:unnamed protein product, partial [Adineta steineri]
FFIEGLSGQVIGIDFGSVFIETSISLAFAFSRIISIYLTRQPIQLMSLIGTTIIYTINGWYLRRKKTYIVNNCSSDLEVNNFFRRSSLKEALDQIQNMVGVDQTTDLNILY